MGLKFDYEVKKDIPFRNQELIDTIRQRIFVGCGNLMFINKIWQVTNTPDEVRRALMRNIGR